MPFPSRSPSGTTRAARRFVADEGGAILVFWGMFLAVAFGFLALAVDFGRVASAQTELQSFADQVALAAAGELDGRSDAITRARAAANALIEDRQTYADGSGILSGAEDFTLTFRTSLPSSDTASAGNTTTSGSAARFVTVTVDEQSVPTPFAAIAEALNDGWDDDYEVEAAATAGVTSYACDVTPLMFCVPDASWRADANRGDMIILVAGGGGTNDRWGAGNFGFLDPTILPIDPNGPCAGLSEAQRYQCLIGAERGITSCLRTDGRVSTLPGQRAGLVDAFNMRFDMYAGDLRSNRTNPAYQPAPNVVKGFRTPTSTNQCNGNLTASSDTMALPQDSCFPNCAGTSTSIRQRFGDGNWDRRTYVTRNHNGTYPSGTNATSTRYEMYLAEIAGASRRSPPAPLPQGKSESGAAYCHSSGSTPDPERRTVIAAAVDCTSQVVNGRSTNIQVIEYVQLFMTEPVRRPGGSSSSSNEAQLTVEVVRSAGGFGSGSTAGAYREIVQLFR